jgi:hypothetical protein
MRRQVVAQLNIAPTVKGPFRITTQVVALPEQPWFQPLNVKPASGTAVRVTFDPVAKVELHDDPQEMPLGDDVTVPVPFPFRAMLRVCDAAGWNVALTETLADIVTVQVGEVPAQAPAHPARTDPAAGDAVSVTLVPDAKPAVQVDPQLIPVGLEDTVPVPAPPFVTDSWYDEADELNTAPAEVAAYVLKVHVDAVPVQAPVQPEKVLPAAATADSVTEVDAGKSAEHVPGQLMPAGEEVTVPAPVPEVETLTGYADVGVTAAGVGDGAVVVGVGVGVGVAVDPPVE